jgi:hypothetical protein
MIINSRYKGSGFSTQLKKVYTFAQAPWSAALFVGQWGKPQWRLFGYAQVIRQYPSRPNRRFHQQNPLPGRDALSARKVKFAVDSAPGALIRMYKHIHNDCGWR